MLTAKAGPELGSKEHKRLLREKDLIIEEFQEMLKDENCVFLYPTHPTVAV
jgi:hypothetical protein